MPGLEQGRATLNDFDVAIKHQKNCNQRRGG